MILPTYRKEPEMKATDFKVKTIIKPHVFPSSEQYYGIALDIGYSGVKGFGPQGYVCFPAYARKQPEDSSRLGEPSDTDIVYKDDNGTWSVGELAYREMSIGEVTDSESELFGRMRYSTPSFLVLARTGIALLLSKAMIVNPGERRIVIQTGLPPKYLREDAEYIQEVFAGEHDFYLSSGKHGFIHYHFEIRPEDVLAPIAQPMGAVLSVSIDQDGDQVEKTSRLMKSNVVVIDPGFGTLDDFSIVNGRVQGIGETFRELGMREVFRRTCDDIQKKYHVKYEVPQLQSALEKGEIWVMNKREMKRTPVNFESLLIKNCSAVCQEALEKLKVIHDYFQDTDFIIGSGGTYDAWKEEFNGAFRNMEGLEIIPGNVNEPQIPNIFSNVRGYYFYMLSLLRAKDARNH